MKTAIKTVRGVHDILPDDSTTWQYLEATARRVFAQYGYRELRTPLFEKSELFARAVGATSDIVEKEMYTFADRGGDSLSLRPEGTASVVRSFINNSMHRLLPWRVFYIGPMFRYERPQKGRQRQFHQIGCELFGPEGPLADAELMAMVMGFFRTAGVAGNLSLEINSLGCSECRGPYREKLLVFLNKKMESLCENCQGRMERNPLRVLDCKKPGCGEVAQQAPHMGDNLCTVCDEHFSGLKSHLTLLQQPFQVNPLLVRGLDYYNRTAFEVTTDALGAQNAVAAGGRYDGLVAEMGGQSTPAIGFAMGLERLVLLLEQGRVVQPEPTVYVVVLGDVQGAESAGLLLAEQLRAAGMVVEMNLTGGSMKTQMKRAGRSKAKFTAIIGGREMLDSSVVIKNMANGEQSTVTTAEAVVHLSSHIDQRKG
ncbi:MAG: histidine--tRNA ligase [Magnetococcales bacterium]|nr:histidine--tRNA ligase [Magnetococcales bacterium]